MKTSLKFFSAISLATLLFTACSKEGTWGIKGEGDAVTQTRDLGKFNEIESSIDAEILYTQDSTTSIEISAQQNILSVLDITVSGNVLKIGFKRNVWTYSKVRLVIHTPELKHIDMSGSGDFLVQNKLTGSEFQIDISGSGNVSIPTVTLTNLDTRISGSGTVKITTGTVTTQKVVMSGSGFYSTENVMAQNADLNISGSGEIIVTAQNRLWVSLSGSGKVKYHGKPLITTEISGSGKLIALD